MLTLEEYPGGERGQIMMLSIQRANVFTMETATLSSLKTFSSSKGIHLGMTQEQLVDLLGKPHEQFPGETRTTLRYRCIEPARCPVLSRANMPKYEAVYVFAKGALVHFHLGFPYS